VEKIEVSQIVGAKIRKIRLTKGFSIQNLAYEIGIEYTQLSRIERGKINTSIYQLFLISRALDVNFADIIQGLDKI
jgi:transcriptional regulator with XRE-family HTH domain